MEYREIDVTLISAQNLKRVNAFGKMTVYGVVWIYPNMKVATPLDTRGHLNPTWNSTLKLTADERLVQDGNAVVHIDLYDRGSFGDNYVGSSSVPFSGLKRVEDDLQAGSSSTSSNFMTVPVVRPSGRARGTLNVSVRLGELIKYPEQPPPYAPGQDAPVAAYPPGYGAPQYPIYQQAPYYPYGGYAPPPPLEPAWAVDLELVFWGVLWVDSCLVQFLAMAVVLVAVEAFELWCVNGGRQRRYWRGSELFSRWESEAPILVPNLLPLGRDCNAQSSILHSDEESKTWRSDTTYCLCW